LFDSRSVCGEGVRVTRVEQFLRRHGGFATRAAIVAATSRAEFDAAVRHGDILWFSRGRYGVPDIDLDLMTAHGLRGVLSHTSAALWHGWEIKTLPEKTHVTIPRRRRLRPPPRVDLHHADLRPEDVVDRICTSPRRTLLDCLRTLPPDEALAIGDSALRHGVRRRVLDDIGSTARGPGRPRLLAVVRQADARAANPFESCLRWIALQVEGLNVEPQQWIVNAKQNVRPDLVDARLGIVLEAESFAWHGDRAALKRDARRFNLLVADGWIVLRFAWEDVMYDPEYVREVLLSVVDARTQARRCTRCAA
jgi:very-short-patch-repair endonuclease